MKFYKKKEISQEETPILFRLERRHTVLEGGKHEIADDESRRASRANSVGSYTRSDTPTDMKLEAALSSTGLSDDNRSNFSPASTVVITESELSSSWLYKARKARIDSDDENISTNIPSEEPNIQPVPLRDPALKPVPVPLKSRPEKVSSCCCYLLVAITICIASLGIMAAIGGIVYLEVFAVYREVAEGQQTTQAPPLEAAVDRKGDSSLNKFRNFEDGTISSNKDFRNEEIIKKNIDSNEEISNKSKDLEQNPFLDEPNKEVTGGDSSKSDFDLYGQSNESATFNPGSSSQGKVEVDSVKQTDTGEVDGSDSIFSSFHNNESVRNISLENQDEVEMNDHSVGNPNDDSLDTIPSNQNSRIPGMEQEIPVNSLDDSEENFNISIADISQNEDPESENILGFEPQNLFDDSSLEQFVLNRPIVEAKPPIEFHKRLVSNQNPDSNLSLTIKDMDRKFSLSEILKHLRTLDSSNKLPSSRQKSDVTETVGISSLDIGTERKEYLNKLRRKIYD